MALGPNLKMPINLCQPPKPRWVSFLCYGRYYQSIQFIYQTSTNIQINTINIEGKFQIDIKQVLDKNTTLKCNVHCLELCRCDQICNIPATQCFSYRAKPHLTAQLTRRFSHWGSTCPPVHIIGIQKRCVQQTFQLKIFLVLF